MSSFFIDVLSGLAVALYGLKGGYTKVNVKGQSIRIAVDNFRTLQRAKTYTIKEPDTLNWLDSFEPGSCYFDLGANIGQYSLYPAKKYGNDIQVYSFEPQCANYYLLNKNIYLNKLEKNITAYCVAVSGEEGFSKLYIPKFIGGGKPFPIWTRRFEEHESGGYAYSGNVWGNPGRLMREMGVSLSQLYEDRCRWDRNSYHQRCGECAEKSRAQIRDRGVRHSPGAG